MRKKVLALGTFDGFHLGHKKVIDAAVAFARRNRLESAVVTFDPHPASVVGRADVKLLTTVEERKVLFGSSSPDKVIVAKFTKKLGSMDYAGFVKKVLLNELNVAHVFAGQDYTFGRGKEGNIAKLKKLGAALGFGVTAVKDKVEKGRTVKSTLIRALVSKGRFSHALDLMGHPYLICGRVEKGRRVGRLLGYPTANIRTAKEKLLPNDGVYACAVRIGRRKFKGAMNIGMNPTFGRKERTVEVFLIGFKGELLGKKVCIEVIKRIRAEKKFSKLSDLIKAINRDVSIAKKIVVC